MTGCLSRYFLVAFHQLHCLTFDEVPTTNNVREYRRQVSSLKLCCRDSNEKLTSILVLRIQLNIVLLFSLSAKSDPSIACDSHHSAQYNVDKRLAMIP